MDLIMESNSPYKIQNLGHTKNHVWSLVSKLWNSEEWKGMWFDECWVMVLFC